MKKKLKKWGTGLGLYFNKEDQDIYGLVEGGVIDIDDMLVQKIKKKVKKK